MRIVNDWRDWWKWWSVRALALIAVLPVVWLEIPSDVKAYIPVEAQPWIVTAMALAGIVGRLKDQS